MNDLDKNLIDFLNISKYQGLKPFFDYINEMCKDLTKEKFNKIINNRKPNDLQSWFFYQKVYNFRKGVFPQTRKYGNYDIKKYRLLDDFFKNNKTYLYNGSYINILNKFKNDEKALIFLDPPYLDSFNSYYTNYNDHRDEDGSLIDNTKMYEDIGDLLENNKSKVITIMNDIALIRYVYKKYYKKSYNKKYSYTQKVKDGNYKDTKTQHAVFSNF